MTFRVIVLLALFSGFYSTMENNKLHFEHLNFTRFKLLHKTNQVGAEIGEVTDSHLSLLVFIHGPGYVVTLVKDLFLSIWIKLLKQTKKFKC